MPDMSTITAVSPATGQPLSRPEAISYGDIAGFLKCHFAAISRGTLAGLCIALAYLIVTKPIYTARTQLLLDSGATQPLPRGAGDLLLALDASQVESQIAVLRSEGLAMAVINKLSLVNDPEIGDGAPLSETSSEKPAAQKAEDAAAVESKNFDRLRRAIGNFQSRLDVRRVGLSFAIDISFSSRDPEKSARIANEVSDAYVRDQIDIRTQAARRGSEWLEKRIDELRSQMNLAALDVQEFKARRDYRIMPRRERPEGDQKLTPPDPASRSDQITLEELEARARTYRNIYESYLQAYTDSVQRQTSPISSSRVITSATKPLTRSHPKSVLTLITGGMLGLLGGLGFAFAHHATNPVVWSTRQMREHGLRVLGVLAKPDRTRRLPLAARLFRKFIVALSTLLGAPGGWTLIRFSPIEGLRRRLTAKLAMFNGQDEPQEKWRTFSRVLNDPASRTSDSIRAIKSSIGLDGSRRTACTIGITSVSKDASKSALAANLAILYADSGLRTLLVDFDLHDPVLSRTLGLDPANGLIEVLTSKAPLIDCLASFEFAGRPLQGLDILAMGAHTLTVPGLSLFRSDAVRARLDEWIGAYDIVIIDMPPSRLSNDSMMLGALLDEVVIVASEGVTPLQQILSVADQFRAAGVLSLNAVLSGWRAPPSPGNASSADKGSGERDGMDGDDDSAPADESRAVLETVVH